jgi:carbamoyl-phosphate synthase large subunit
MNDRILVAGIGGASLGSEVMKSLRAAGRYDVYGCDISPLAFGHYATGQSATFVVERNRYVDAVLDICRANQIRAIIPGGEGPLSLLGASAAMARLRDADIMLAANSPEVTALCSDKARCFARLRELGLPIPSTIIVEPDRELNESEVTSFPQIIKPAGGTGGSRFVFLARDWSETRLYTRLLSNLGRVALVQTYVPLDEGEFTIGVLSLPDGRTVGSIAMKRIFHTKLSVLFESETGLVSSGYSQGWVAEFPDLCRQAEGIAEMIGSIGPINVQARVKDGVLLPFEINPRFSASTYLRTLAGYNEIDVYLQAVLHGRSAPPPAVKRGYYLRSLSEVSVPAETERMPTR